MFRLVIAIVLSLSSMVASSQSSQMMDMIPYYITCQNDSGTIFNKQHLITHHYRNGSLYDKHQLSLGSIVGCQVIYSRNKTMMGKISNNRFYNSRGQLIGSISNDTIYDNKQMLIGRIKGDTILDHRSLVIMTFE